MIIVDMECVSEHLSCHPRHRSGDPVPRSGVPAGQVSHRHAQGTADWVAVYVCETETVVADVLLDMFVCVTVCLVEKHVFL